MTYDPYPDYMAERAGEEFDGRYDRDFVRALDLHKERIRRLKEALCECPHREFFQADLHDEACPVYVIAAAMRGEYESRV